MEHSFQYLKTFRYYTYGDPVKAKTALYVLHGYGQLAEYFIRKFHELDESIFIIAPEGMHRFYVNGTSGRVGASWMTKEARTTDISDTINWLDKLEEEINSKYKFDKKIILGFSQGGATAARWSTYGKYKPDSIIYWASVFPPDLEEELSKEIDINKNNHFVLGNKDEYFSEQQQVEILNYYAERGFQTHLFEGNHTIHHPILTHVLRNVQKKIYFDL